MITKVLGVLVHLLDLSFAKSIPFFWRDLMIRYQVGKGDKNVFNLPTQQIQKMENTYNTEGPKGSEVGESNKT